MSGPDARPPRWFGLVRFPGTVTRPLLYYADRFASGLGPWYGWLLVGLFVGIAPVLLQWMTGWPGQQALSAGLLVPLFIAGAATDSPRKAAIAVGAAGVVHCALVIGLVARYPSAMAGAFPPGVEYWQKSEQWIRTGYHDEYVLTQWVPQHLLLLVAVVLFGYSSLGFVILWQGFYELDLMNYYVGNLLHVTSEPAVAIGLGWHTWSMCRAAGYFLLLFELVSLSCEQLIGVRLSNWNRRRSRWALGIGLLLCDGLLKLALLDRVRLVLLAGLPEI